MSTSLLFTPIIRTMRCKGYRVHHPLHLHNTFWKQWCSKTNKDGCSTKSKRQYLLTLQVSRYCLLALLSSTHDAVNRSVGRCGSVSARETTWQNDYGVKRGVHHTEQPFYPKDRSSLWHTLIGFSHMKVCHKISGRIGLRNVISGTMKTSQKCRPDVAVRRRAEADLMTRASTNTWHCTNVA